MTVAYPIWFLLVVPLAVLLWRYRPANGWLLGLRIAGLLAILAALAGLAVRLPDRHGTVVVLADRSRSMPAEAQTRQLDAINLIGSTMDRDDHLHVISFGRNVVAEPMADHGRLAGFATEIDPHASSLASALDAAFTAIPPESPGRILMLTDGRWTGRDPESVAVKAAMRTIPIDYRFMERERANDLAITELTLPESVSPGEAYMLTAWVFSPVQQELECRLTRNGHDIAVARRSLAPGTTRLTFRDIAEQPGTILSRFHLNRPENDPVPENNTARALLGVDGTRPILCVGTSSGSGLAETLRAGRLTIDYRPASQCQWSLDMLSRYAAVILEDVSAQEIGRVGMDTLAAWVRQSRAGLMVTGGKNAYALGGYFRSPLESVMPVSMELRTEHRKLSLAIVIAMDRSGSMAAPVGAGRSKMDLANLAVAEVLDMLTPIDQLGVIAVDSSAHPIVSIAPVETVRRQRNRILGIESQGGGIFVYEALAHAAEMIASAGPMTRHIILFADAADSEQPGDYKKLLEECAQAGITVSVIGLGTPGDVDAPLLKDIAERGGGRCFFTQTATELPRLFAQDTFIVARNTFLEDTTPVQATAGLWSLTGETFELTQPVGGYNLCYLRPKATVAAVTVDEYTAPLVAAWPVGMGRCLCYTGQADGEFTGPIARWGRVGDFFTSLVRWTAGMDTRQALGAMLVTQRVENGRCLVQLHLDPERSDGQVAQLPDVTILHGRAGHPPQSQTVSMTWTDPDTLSAEWPMTGDETSLATVDMPGVAAVSLPLVCLPYSPEYQQQPPDRYRERIDELARMTRGRQRLSLADIWGDLPAKPRYYSLGPGLLLLAVLLLLMEVFHRRTDLLSRIRTPRWLRSLTRLHSRPFSGNDLAGAVSSDTLRVAKRRAGSRPGSSAESARRPRSGSGAGSGSDSGSDSTAAAPVDQSQSFSGQPLTHPIRPGGPGGPSSRGQRSQPTESSQGSQGQGQSSLLDSLSKARTKADKKTGKDRK